MEPRAVDVGSFDAGVDASPAEADLPRLADVATRAGADRAAAPAVKLLQTRL